MLHRPGSAIGPKPMLPRGRARCEIAAEAPAAERDPGRIDDGDGEREIDDGPYDGLPIGPEGRAVLDQHFALTRAIED